MTFSATRSNSPAPRAAFSLDSSPAIPFVASSASNYTPILLASASPRRAQILETLGVPFRVVRSSFQEPAPRADDHQNPARFVEFLAREKARGFLETDDLETDDLETDDLETDDLETDDLEISSAANVNESASGESASSENRNVTNGENSSRLVLAADTIVWHDGEILGKPRDAADAVSMLRRLRGAEHEVLTGVCLRHFMEGNIEYSTAHATTKVQFRDVGDDWITRYVATGEPLDKAGSYGAQGKGALLVESIRGDYWNVVGLPLAPLRALLQRAGAPIEAFWDAAGSVK